ncbi:hypothetical protein ANO11243_051750 [Dothideomycetidae sp. 11243]|nr:hypothetical protein ANO11243_051750 [fungal sp. No.11243]
MGATVALAIHSSGPGTFPLFFNLPTEIRLQIWRHTLPDEVGQVLYHHQKNLWHPRWRDPSEPGYNPPNNGEQGDLILEFHHHKLDDVKITLPMLLVNREARSVALAWLSKQQGLKKDILPDGTPAFTKSFDPQRDALYLPFDNFNEIFQETAYRAFEPDMAGLLHSTWSGTFYLAIPERVWSDDATYGLGEYFSHFNCHTLFIVHDEDSQIQGAGSTDLEPGQWWEIESCPEMAIFWDAGSKTFEARSVEGINTAVQNDLIERARGMNLAGDLSWWHIHQLEIRPARRFRRGQAIR